MAKNQIIITKKGDLEKFGYYLTEPKASVRREALAKAVKAYGYLSVMRKVNALAVLHRGVDEKYAKRAESDKNWLKKTYGKNSSSNPRSSSKKRGKKKKNVKKKGKKRSKKRR